MYDATVALGICDKIVPWALDGRLVVWSFTYGVYSGRTDGNGISNDAKAQVRKALQKVRLVVRSCSPQSLQPITVPVPARLWDC